MHVCTYVYLCRCVYVCIHICGYIYRYMNDYLYLMNFLWKLDKKGPEVVLGKVTLKILIYIYIHIYYNKHVLIFEYVYDDEIYMYICTYLHKEMHIHKLTYMDVIRYIDAYICILKC
jgi:hypothetical protein